MLAVPAHILVLFLLPAVRSVQTLHPTSARKCKRCIWCSLSASFPKRSGTGESRGGQTLRWCVHFGHLSHLQTVHCRVWTASRGLVKGLCASTSALQRYLHVTPLPSVLLVFLRASNLLCSSSCLLSWCWANWRMEARAGSPDVPVAGRAAPSELCMMHNGGDCVTALPTMLGAQREVEFKHNFLRILPNYTGRLTSWGRRR